jgi:hypothetical protein
LAVKAVSMNGRCTFSTNEELRHAHRRSCLMLGGTDDYTSCPDCGTSVNHESLVAELHRCDRRHRDEHVERVGLRALDLFERELGAYLSSPQGRFEVFYAARSRTG